MNILHVTPSLSPSGEAPLPSYPSSFPPYRTKESAGEIATTRGHRVGRDAISPKGIPTHIFDTGLPAASGRPTPPS